MSGHIFDNRNTITLREFAYLSLNVYHDCANNSLLGARPTKVKTILEFAFMASHSGWYHLEFDYPHMPLLMDLFLYVDLYLKCINGKIRYIVFSYRGTSNLADKAIDIVTWTTNVVLGNQAPTTLPTIMLDYIAFYSVFAFTKIKSLQEMNLLHDKVEYYATGHSLGGALAQMDHGIWSLFRPVCAVAFNAPGVGHIYGNTFGWNEENSVNIRSRYDIVSAIGAPYGYFLNAFIPDRWLVAKEYFIKMYEWVNKGGSESNAASFDKQLIIKTKGIIDFKETFNLSTFRLRWLKKYEEAYDKSKFAFAAQHSMHNLYQSILESKYLDVDFKQLKMLSASNNGFKNIYSDITIN